MGSTKEVGNEGETIAANYLARKGYIILERNWQHWYANIEVDIIAQKDDQLVFIEVKTRTKASYGKPHYTISEAQQGRLHKASELYQEQKGLFMESRFDVIGVINTGTSVQVTHMPGAF